MLGTAVTACTAAADVPRSLPVMGGQPSTLDPYAGLYPSQQNRTLVRLFDVRRSREATMQRNLLVALAIVVALCVLLTVIPVTAQDNHGSNANSNNADRDKGKD